MNPEIATETASVEHNIEFQSIWPYIPILGLYFLLVIFSVGFASASSSNYVPWCSVIIISGAMLLVTTKLFSDVIKTGWIRFWQMAVDPENEYDLQTDPTVFQSGTLDLIPAAEMFIAWLSMGVLLRQYPIIDVVSQAVSALWLLWLAMLQLNSVRSVAHVRKSITIGFYLAMIFVPSDDGIATKLAWYTLLLKATMAYLLFVLVSVEAASVWAIAPRKSSKKRKASRKKNRPRESEEYLASTESKIVQSSWVLITPNILLIAAVLLGVVLVYRIFRNNRILDKKHDRASKSSDTNSKKERKKEKRKSRKGKGRAKDSDVESGAYEQPPGREYLDNGTALVQWNSSGQYPPHPPSHGYESFSGYSMNQHGHFVQPEFDPARWDT